MLHLFLAPRHPQRSTLTITRPREERKRERAQINRSHRISREPRPRHVPGLASSVRRVTQALSRPKKPNPSTQKPNRRCLLALCPTYFSAPGGRGRLHFPDGNVSPPPRLPPSTSVALLLVVWKKTICATATITTSTTAVSTYAARLATCAKGFAPPASAEHALRAYVVFQ